MAYNPTTKIVAYPVGLNDIRRAISGTRMDLGTLCSSGTKINKWAKYKPVRLAVIDTATQLKSDKTWKADADWFIGDKNGERYGMLFPNPVTATSPMTIIRHSDGDDVHIPGSGSFFYDLMNNNLRWTYVAPTGGATSIYRQIDFNLYNHAAPCPLPYTEDKTVGYSNPQNPQINYIAAFDRRSLDDDMLYGLKLDDIQPSSSYQLAIPDLGEMYLGVLFIDPNRYDVFWKCSEYKLKSLWGSDPAARVKCMHISLSGSDFGKKIARHQKWKTRCFLCTTPLTWCQILSGFDTGVTYYLVACDDDESEVKFIQSGAVVVDRFIANRISGDIRCYVWLTNNTGQSQQIGTVSNKPTITLYDGSTAGSSHQFDPFTLADGDTIELQYTFTRELLTLDTATFTAIYGSSNISSSTDIVTKP